MWIIGITGGVGAGKSSVLEYIKKHCNCRIILADEVGNQVKEPGQICYQQLVKLLGEQVLMDNGQIHRGKMAEMIFSDKELLEKVNAIIHPAVQEYILQAIQEEKEKQEIDVFFSGSSIID